MDKQTPKRLLCNVAANIKLSPNLLKSWTGIMVSCKKVAKVNDTKSLFHCISLLIKFQSDQINSWLLFEAIYPIFLFWTHREFKRKSRKANFDQLLYLTTPLIFKTKLILRWWLTLTLKSTLVSWSGTTFRVTSWGEICSIGPWVLSVLISAPDTITLSSYFDSSTLSLHW